MENALAFNDLRKEKITGTANFLRVDVKQVRKIVTTFQFNILANMICAVKTQKKLWNLNVMTNCFILDI